MSKWFRLEWAKHWKEACLSMVLISLVVMMFYGWLVWQAEQEPIKWKEAVSLSLQLAKNERSAQQPDSLGYQQWDQQVQRLYQLERFSLDEAVFTPEQSQLIKEIDQNWIRLGVEHQPSLTMGSIKQRQKLMKVYEQKGWSIPTNARQPSLAYSLYALVHGFSLGSFGFLLIITFALSAYEAGESQLYLALVPTSLKVRRLARSLFFLLFALAICVMGMATLALLGGFNKGLGTQLIVENGQTVVSALFHQLGYWLIGVFGWSSLVLITSSLDKQDRGKVMMGLICLLSISYLWLAH